MKNLTGKFTNILLILIFLLSLSSCMEKTVVDEEKPSDGTTTEETAPEEPEVKKTDSLSAPVLKNALSGDSQVFLSWEKQSNADSYIIYWGTSSGSYTSQIEVTEGDSNFTVTELINDQTYYFAIKAKQADGLSDFSNELSATPKSGTNNISFGKPNGVLLTPEDSQIKVSWNQNGEADSYIVFWGTKSGEYTNQKSSITTSHTIKGLTNNTEYFVIVKAVKGDEISEASEEKSSTPTSSERAQGTKKPKPDDMKPKPEPIVPAPKPAPRSLKGDIDVVFETLTEDNFTYHTLKGRKSILKATDGAISSFSSMGLAGFKQLGNSEKIAQLINIYNVMVLDNIKKLDPPLHAALMEDMDDEKMHEEFAKGKFFTQDNFDLFGKKFSLNDMSFGILLGDENYINSIGDAGKKDLIKKFHDSINFGDEDFNMELLFLMPCGSRAFPLPYSLPMRRGMEAKDIDDLLANKRESDLGKFISEFLGKNALQLDIDPDRGGFLSLGDVKALDFKLPFIFKFYNDALERVFKSKSYKKALVKFLYDYLPEDFEDREDLSKEYPDEEIGIEFVLDPQLLYLD